MSNRGDPSEDKGRLVSGFAADGKRYHILKVLDAMIAMVILVVVYFLVVPALLIIFFDKIVRLRAKTIIVNVPSQSGLAYAEIFVPVDDKTRLQTWWMSHSTETKNTILFIHGNARNISYFCDYFEKLHHELDANILAVCLRGYGGSEGKFALDTVLLDLERCIDFYREKFGLRNQDFVVLGRSQGTLIASELAVGREFKALILESGMTSLHDYINFLFRKSWIFYPYSILNLARFKTRMFDTGANLARTNCPVLVIHGGKDSSVPVSMALANARARNGIRKLILKDAGHSDCSKYTGYFEAMREIVLGRM